MAIVFGLENLTFLAKSDIFIPKYTEGGALGSTDLGNIPKNYQFFVVLPLGIFWAEQKQQQKTKHMMHHFLQRTIRGKFV